jgi:hypothetical protein
MTPNPDLWRALAEGLDRLNDGDESDRALADRVERQMLEDHRMIRSGGYFFPAEQATTGFTVDDSDRWVFTHQLPGGDWVDELEQPANRRALYHGSENAGWVFLRFANND